MAATERPGSEAHLAQLGEEKTALKKSQSTTHTNIFKQLWSQSDQVRSDQKLLESQSISLYYKEHPLQVVQTQNVWCIAQSLISSLLTLFARTIKPLPGHWGIMLPHFIEPSLVRMSCLLLNKITRLQDKGQSPTGSLGWLVCCWSSPAKK